MFKNIFSRVLSRKDMSNKRAGSLSKMSLPSRFKQIGEISLVESSKKLPSTRNNKNVLIIDDFSHGDIGRYVTEEHQAKASYSIEGKGMKGKCLKVHYQLNPLSQEFRSVDIARKFITEEDVQDWSAFRFLNLTVRVKKHTTLFRVCIVEEDGDWWNFINNEYLEGGKWYWIKIPMKDMFLLEDFSIQGDGKQDLSKVAELRMLFDSTNIGQNLTENTAYIDQVFLSN